jgi:hypothetical protein
MIDNFEKAIELMEDMKSVLPISVRPTPEILQMLNRKSIPFPDKGEWQIETLLYSGDEGGIVCGICLSKDSKEVLLISLTHLRVDCSCLFYARLEIRAGGCADAFLHRAFWRRPAGGVALWVAGGQREQSVQNRFFAFLELNLTSSLELV